LHTRVPIAFVHVESPGGDVGSGVPLSSFATHDPDPPAGALHHCVDAQSVSTAHAFPHDPVAESHTGPACVAPTQSEVVAHLPHAPLCPPLSMQ
jgi:hypothetical protein